MNLFLSFILCCLFFFSFFVLLRQGLFSLGCPGTHVDQAGLELTEVHLPLRSLFSSLGTLLFGAVWAL